jgi:hypothetical protein
MRVLFVFIVLEHQRRKVLHFGVTEHPTAEWVGQQVVEAFAEREAPRYLIRDRDASYSLFQYKMSLKENSVSNTRRAWSGWHAED